MNSALTVLDCDFGHGEVEAGLCAEAGLDFNFFEKQEPGYEYRDLDSIAVLTQYTPITRTFLKSNPKLRAVVRYGVGLDVIDEIACAEFGVAVSGVVDYCTEEVADHTMALLLSITRGIVAADRAAKRDEITLPQELVTIRRLRGTRLGLIGVGRIAEAVAARARAFGIDVVGYDAHLSDQAITARGVRPEVLSEVLAADFVSLHLPLLDSTREIFDAEKIAIMRPGSVILNVSRGGLIDEHALHRALRSGHIAFAGLDVLSDESRRKVAMADNVVFTPHIGYYSPESLQELRERATSRAIELVSGSVFSK